MRKIIISLLSASWLVFMLSACQGRGESDTDVLRSIRDCAELEVAEFSLHKNIVERTTTHVLEFMENPLLTLPERTLILPVDVRVVGKIDFSSVTERNLVYNDKDKLVFLLPDPTLPVLSVVPDYERSRQLSRESWIRGSYTDAELTKFVNQAYDSIMVESTLQMMAARTRDNAAAILIPLLSDATGVPQENIIIEYRSDLNSRKATRDNTVICFDSMKGGVR